MMLRRRCNPRCDPPEVGDTYYLGGNILDLKIGTEAKYD